MSAIILPARSIKSWQQCKNPDPRKKPPLGSKVDQTDPINAGLVGAWLFNEGAGAGVTDLVSSKVGTPTAPLVWTPTPDGSGLTYDGVTSKVQFTSLGEWKTHGISILTNAIYNANVGGEIVSFASNVGIRLYTSYQDGIMRFWFSRRGPTDLTLRYATAFSLGVPIQTVLTHDGVFTTPASAICYLNGKSNAPDYQVAGTTEASVTAGPAIGYSNLQATLTHVAIYKDRALSASEVAQLYAEPYKGIIWPSNRRYYPFIISSASTGEPKINLTWSIIPLIWNFENGRTGTININYENVGSTASEDFTIYSNLPNNSTYVAGSADATGGVYDAITNRVYWEITATEGNRGGTKSFQILTN